MCNQIESESEINTIPEDLPSIVRRLGNPVSTLLPYSACSIFRVPDVDGIIAYQMIRNRAVVMGDPICLPEDIEPLTLAFNQYCKKLKLRVIYFLVSDSFAHWAINNGCHTLIQGAEELVIDPTNLKKKAKLRWKINQAIQHGVVIKEYDQFDPMLENQMKSTIETWLKEKHGPQIHLGDLDLFVAGVDKRIFYAVQNNKIIGLLKLLPVDRFKGWSLNFFLGISGAPVGTTEHLMCSAFDTLAYEKCRFVSLGAISGSKIGEIVGLSSFSQYCAHLGFKAAKWIFKLDAKKIYFSKYQPKLSPTYLIFGEKLNLMDLI